MQQNIEVCTENGNFEPKKKIIWACLLTTSENLRLIWCSVAQIILSMNAWTPNQSYKSSHLEWAVVKTIEHQDTGKSWIVMCSLSCWPWKVIKINIFSAICKCAQPSRVTSSFPPGKYDLDFKNPKSDKSKFLAPEKLMDLYLDFTKNFPIISIEDPFDQDDWEAWSAITSKTNIQIVGDDLTVTNPKRIQQAVEKAACNCLLLKVSGDLCSRCCFVMMMWIILFLLIRFQKCVFVCL